MTVVGRMITRMVAIRFLFIWSGITLFVLSLDILTNVNDILGLGGYGAMASYAFHRYFGILATFLPISVLLALLLALTELSHRNETPPIWAAGVSPFRIMLMLAPLGVALGVAQFLLADRAMPWAAPQLRDWGIGDYGRKQLKIGEKDPIWMRAGGDILRASGSNAGGTELTGVVLFRRDANHLLTEQIFAASAAQRGAGWRLQDAVIYGRENAPPVKLAVIDYDGNLKPAREGARSGDPEEMTMPDLGYFIANRGFGVRPVWVYQTWWHKRLSLLPAALAMIALCVPLAARFRRGGGIGVLFAAGVGLGFVFFIFDGIALTLGELGFVAPWLAAWGPLLIFALIAAMAAFRTETV